MKNKKKIVILVIQLLALLVFIFSYKSYTDTTVKPIDVYSFARDISEGVKVTEKDLVIKEVAANTYTSNMILASDISAIVGKYTTTKVFQTNICYVEQFGDLNTTNTGFTSLDLTNARLMSIPVNIQNDAGGYFEAGDRIDLMFNGSGTSTIVNTNSEGGENSSSSEQAAEEFFYSKIFLQNIVVYDVLNGNGYKYAERATRYEGESAQNIDISDPETINIDSGNISNILIIVTPEQAEQIKVRQTVGQITILKRFEESETHDTLGYVLGNYGKVFSGNANAETGSLQIISTIQDTDNDEDVMPTDKDSIATKGSTKTENTETEEGSSDGSTEESNTGAAIVGSSVE